MIFQITCIFISIISLQKFYYSILSLIIKLCIYILIELYFFCIKFYTYLDPLGNFKVLIYFLLNIKHKLPSLKRCNIINMFFVT
jgi:hypothetical protein